MVNSNDPFNDCASLQSYYTCRKASREPQPPSEQPVDNPYSGAWTLHQDRRSLSSPSEQKSPVAGLSRSSMRRPTRQCMAASPVAKLHHSSRLPPIFKPMSLVFLSNTCITLFCPLFSPTTYTFRFFFDFSSKFDTTEALHTIWSCFVLSESTDSVASVTLY